MKNRLDPLKVKQYFQEQSCELLDDYKSIDIPMTYRCSCGNTSKISFYRFRRGERCFECSGSKKRGIEEVARYFKEQGCELLENQYHGNKAKMKYKCKCGRISYVNFNNFTHGTRCRNCAIDNLTGPNNSRYNPNLTPEDRERTADPKYREWRRMVYKRDDYTCKKCGRKSGILNAHHIKNYTSFPEGRLDPANGITLCKKCHKGFHSKYGNTGNDGQQLQEYLILCSFQPKACVCV